MLDLLAGFVTELRNAGLPVSLTENLDAMEAVQHIPIEDREAFKYALGATLVKNNAHWRAFETVFEVYFSLRGPEYSIAENADLDEIMQQIAEQQRQGDANGTGGGMESLTPEELMNILAMQSRSQELSLEKAAKAATSLGFSVYTPPDPPRYRNW